VQAKKDEKMLKRFCAGFLHCAKVVDGYYVSDYHAIERQWD
jgi:hypothetical protein